MNKIKLLLAGLLVCLSATVTPASAQVFIGSWQVDEGPSWYGSPPDGPLAYTGQEAAALLFGGVASDYVISTVSNLVADIDHQAWYSIIGYGGNGGGTAFAENYSNKYLGSFYGPTDGYPFGDINASASAYVNDNASGSQFTNYAFRVGAVPEPETYAMMLAGLGLLGFAARRRKQQSA